MESAETNRDERDIQANNTWSSVQGRQYIVLSGIKLMVIVDWHMIKQSGIGKNLYLD